MSTTIQLAIVGVVVFAATAYLVRALWKSWSRKSAKGCSAGCGKCSAGSDPKTEGRFPLPQV